MTYFRMKIILISIFYKNIFH